MFLALTGYRLEGADTFHAGLATHYVNFVFFEIFTYMILDRIKSITSRRKGA